MILDTSMILFIIQREPGWERHSQTLQDAEQLLISAGTLQELLIVAHCRNLLDSVETLLEVLDPDVVPVDARLARRAVEIFERFGKDQGHGARLNFVDCFAAALASERKLPLAFVGDDFAAAGYSGSRG
jgi:ribonuclease VapC